MQKVAGGFLTARRVGTGGAGRTRVVDLALTDRRLGNSVTLTMGGTS